MSVRLLYVHENQFRSYKAMKELEKKDPDILMPYPEPTRSEWYELERIALQYAEKEQRDNFYIQFSPSINGISYISHKTGEDTTCIQL